MLEIRDKSYKRPPGLLMITQGHIQSTDVTEATLQRFSCEQSAHMTRAARPCPRRKKAVLSIGLEPLPFSQFYGNILKDTLRGRAREIVSVSVLPLCSSK